MDRIIQQVTDYFVSQLPEGKEYYRVKDLETHHFPAFLSRRIHIELEWNLDESMVLPQTDWANTQSEAVQQAWQHFLRAIHAEVKLPASYAKAVIETAVADVFEMLVQPRKNIIDILFGGEDELKASELKERAELLVVYPHFSRVLISYMDRKNKNKLVREKCKEIIAQVDEKVTSKYTPLQWAQMLDPLFKLTRTKVDTNLLRLFFEDRKMHSLARRFDMMDAAVTRAEFIEVLSSPELLNYDGYETNPSKLLKDEESDQQSKKQREEPVVPPQEYINPENEHDTLSNETRQESEITKNGEINLEEESAEDDESVVPEIEDNSRDKVVRSQPNEVSEVEAEPDFEIKPERMKEDSSREQDIEEINESASLNDIFSDDESPQDEKHTSQADKPFISKSVLEEESLLWQRFRNEEDEDEDEEQNQPDEPEREDEFHSEESSADFIRDNYSVEDKRSDLEDLLKDRETYFIKELFNGSQEAYEKSLVKIAKENEWEWASKLIANNIFKRHHINIYSTAAVDFIDRLQSYFLDKDNSNQ